jgi:hypothetical protein
MPPRPRWAGRQPATPRGHVRSGWRDCPLRESRSSHGRSAILRAASLLPCTRPPSAPPGSPRSPSRSRHAADPPRRERPPRRLPAPRRRKPPIQPLRPLPSHHRPLRPSQRPHSTPSRPTTRRAPLPLPKSPAKANASPVASARVPSPGASINAVPRAGSASIRAAPGPLPSAVDLRSSPLKGTERGARARPKRALRPSPPSGGHRSARLPTAARGGLGMAAPGRLACLPRLAGV